MEFSYRDEYEPPSPPQYGEQKPRPPPPHSVYAGYRKPENGLSSDYFGLEIGPTNEHFRQGIGWTNEYFRISSNVREEIGRSLEKERIRDEIIAAEIARRRVLEAEVRAEIRMERELALRAIREDAFSRFSFPLGSGMVLEPRGVTFQQETKGLEEQGYGLSSDYFGREIGPTNEYFRQGIGWANEYFHISSNVCEEIRRSLEKERIGDEIIAAEIARRRVLEAEVRVEIRMERELALRAIREDAFSRFSFPLGAGMAFEPRGVTFQQEAKGLEDRIARYAEERLRIGKRCETQGFDTLPFKRRSVELEVKGVTPSHLENSKQKEKIVFLAKPSASLSGAKKKVVPLAEDSGNTEGKEEWSCVICQVSTTSKCGLKDHFQGKKHRSKEAALRAKRNGCNIGIGVLPKKTVKHKIEVTHLISPQVGGEAPQIDQSVLSSPQVRGEVLQVNQSVLRSPQGLKLGGEALQINQSEPSSLHIVSTKCLDENSVSVLQENEEKDKLKKRKLIGVKAPKSKLKEKKNFTFWCDMCQVGTYCEIVMEGHWKGKKHLKLLEKARENGQAILTSRTVDIEGANDADETTKEGDKKTFENVDRTNTLSRC